MSTLTSRLKLVKAALTDPANYVTYVADAFDKIDAAAGLTVCTSTTRPASPFVGQWILETDTQRRAHWDGTGWRCTTGGTFVATTNAFGDSNLSASGFSSWLWIIGHNGDQATRTNTNVATYAQPFPLGNPTPSFKAWLASSGAVINTGSIRINWVGEGYLA